MSTVFITNGRNVVNEVQLAQMNDTVHVLGPMQTLWVEALESGKYIQHEEGGAMCVNIGDRKEYCCLGVAAVIFNLSKDFSSLRDYAALGLFSELGYLDRFIKVDGFEFNSLSHMNDGVRRDGVVVKRFTFPEIAAYIRANPSNVFSKSV
jgi:hypothetical protein